MFRVALLLLFLLIGSPLHSEQQSCSWAHGGTVGICYDMASQLPFGYAVPAADYRSAGTMILMNAGCVENGAVFRFHSAFLPGRISIPSYYGNQVQREALYRWPLLIANLDYIRAFESLQFTTKSAQWIASHGGPPLCNKEKAR